MLEIIWYKSEFNNSSYWITAIKIFSFFPYRLFEEDRNAPVTWVPCLKHSNEKPWGKYLLFCDWEGVVKSKSPAFDGHLGKQFKNGIKKLPIINFEQFPNCNFVELPEDLVKSMNSDYKNLYELCLAVKTGECSPELAARILGICHQAR